jgi:hypothetical protein
MSVNSLEDDLQFLQVFQDHVAQLISTVQRWEELDCEALEYRREEGDPSAIGLSFEDATKFNTLRESLPQIRSNINFEIVRLRNIATRYGLSFNENWLYITPTIGRSNPTYAFSFTESLENAIFRDIILIRGAVSDDLKNERRRGARPRRVKARDDYIFPLAHWFIKPEHSKFTLIAGLAIVLALVLRLLGFDGRTIVEIIKAIKSG